LKARFSDPPAPPPQQPLPAKPDAASSLRRSDTERPKTGSPVRPDAQMSSLNEALTSAKKEIETQGVRLRDLEAMLGEERRAREDAEERANRLERKTSKELEEEDLEHATGDSQKDEVESLETEESTTGLEDGSPSTTTADTTSRLQQRLDLMVTEMNEMKQQMERYRERAETAEADRKSLAEMIESIRRDNARTSSREARRRSRSNSQPTQEPAAPRMTVTSRERTRSPSSRTTTSMKKVLKSCSAELQRQTDMPRHTRTRRHPRTRQTPSSRSYRAALTSCTTAVQLVL
jgi:chromosome segregation ATPase